MSSMPPHLARMFADQYSGEPITTQNVDDFLQNDGVRDCFNRASLTLLTRMLGHKGIQWSYPPIYAGSNSNAVHKVRQFMACINKAFEADWQEPTRPATPEANVSVALRNEYHRALTQYKKELHVFSTHRPQAKVWFIAEVLKKWPDIDLINPPHMHIAHEDTLLPEDYPRYVQGLYWAFTRSKNAEGEAFVKSVQDLKAHTIKSLRTTYDEQQKREFAETHFIKCDQEFLNIPIPDDTPDNQRHPDKDTVNTHAEIIATGTTTDGKPWTVRRLNTQAAAMRYGNPTNSHNGSSLCFTWSGERHNHFSTYRNNLFMLSTNDGTETYFLNFSKNMFTDFFDRPVKTPHILGIFFSPSQKPKHHKPDLTQDIKKWVIDTIISKNRSDTFIDEAYAEFQLDNEESIKEKIKAFKDLAQKEAESAPDYRRLMRNTNLEISYIDTIRIDRYINEISKRNMNRNARFTGNPLFKLKLKILQLRAIFKKIPPDQLKPIQKCHEYWADAYNKAITENLCLSLKAEPVHFFEFINGIASGSPYIYINPIYSHGKHLKNLHPSSVFQRSYKPLDIIIDFASYPNEHQDLVFSAVPFIEKDHDAIRKLDATVKRRLEHIFSYDIRSNTPPPREPKFHDLDKIERAISGVQEWTAHYQLLRNAHQAQVARFIKPPKYG